MTKQEIFNKVKKHLLSQNKRSRKSNGICAYRGPDNLKCAVGGLIPDKLYCVEMDSGDDTYITNIVRRYPDLKSFFGCQNIRLLSSLQEVHDNVPVEDWSNELCKVANRFHLKP